MGVTFGKLTVKARADYSHLDQPRHTYWICSCVCNTQCRVRRDALVSKRTQSCGCGRVDTSAKWLHYYATIRKDFAVAIAYVDTEEFKAQKEEFDAVELLSTAYKRITSTPIVDDDYPEVRHGYESAVRNLVNKFRNNKRI